ncbi:MAG: class I SAM-dependent methyltransferase [Ginsengibacter sp.]
METQDAYNNWAKTYDSVVNKTRDLEANAIRAVLDNAAFNSVLEIGCGTGKNTVWLSAKSTYLIAVDFSEEMLQIAKQKISSGNIEFQQFDITKKWAFEKVDLITCSLVLEHIKDISFIFQQAASTLKTSGKFYVCELHPYKQLQGSSAKFEKDGGILELQYFVHHISDYFGAAKQYGFTCDDLFEWFDDDRSQPPRLISFLFKKNN